MVESSEWITSSPSGTTSRVFTPGWKIEFVFDEIIQVKVSSIFFCRDRKAYTSILFVFDYIKKVNTSLRAVYSERILRKERKISNHFGKCGQDRKHLRKGCVFYAQKIAIYCFDSWLHCHSESCDSWIYFTGLCSAEVQVKVCVLALWSPKIHFSIPVLKMKYFKDLL